MEEKNRGGLSILGHIPEKDGILANLLVAEVIAVSQKPLSELVQDIQEELGGPTFNHRIDLRLSEKRKALVMKTLKESAPERVAGLSVQKVGHLDGVKLYLEDDSWVLVRPSGTEPLLRISMEAYSLETQKALEIAMSEWVDNI